ncbi:hypothetical protein Dalk_3234 [Desulfatibacillum aliphaticivorans]|uniref:Lipoprotein n=1 Tax=Desulfatibacillum aliphaticivorans TaxID=218208 RepID=B8FGL5_DESAL|nr:hypothetical protein [Desulfatibacillum aliphaticivorans]ACL04924.1 hypothetical protein Dalk_3234 [Desulfatibacillum aliphaticivorans]
MRKKVLLIVLSGLVLLSLASCQTVHNAAKVDSEDVAKEGTIVFVRPTKHPVLGVRSISDYVEITYEKLDRNEAGLPKVSVGFRNKGGARFYDTKGPDYQISVKTSFYTTPLPSMGGSMSPPVYETNWQTLTMLRGGTNHYSCLCPNKDAVYYQVTVSELLK